jgi:hypothetical protein
MLAFFRKKNVLFYRNFPVLTGGHLKVWDYFNHVKLISGYSSSIYFSASSRWDKAADNPWLPVRSQCLNEWNPKACDILFIEGLDWYVVPVSLREHPNNPVINLIQHVRHSFPDNERYPFLRYPAIRICVSAEVAEAIQATGIVNGPVYTIPNGIDFSTLPKILEQGQRTYDLVICGLKNLPVAHALDKYIRAEYPDLKIKTLDSFIERAQFISILSQARTAIFLPNPTEGEGFYLPALECMALGTLAICPDSMGNRVFCMAGKTCLQPDYTIESFLHCFRQSQSFSENDRAILCQTAYQTAQIYNLEQERRAFAIILKNTQKIWRDFFLKKTV